MPPILSSRLALAALGGGLPFAVLAGPAAAAPHVLYRAIFSNNTPDNQALSAYGWKLETGGGPLGIVAISPELSHRVPDEVAAETPFGVSQPRGVLLLQIPVVPRVALVSTPLRDIRVTDLVALSWEWTTANQTAHLARPALRLGGVWYVPAGPAFTVERSSVFFASATRAEFRFASLAAADWIPITALDSRDTGGLPRAAHALAGPVEAVGLWLRAGGSPGAIRIDNFEVTARVTAPAL